ncbi:MAG: mechanosensitive ion channel domain-containing protein [Candidatus Dormibacteraceae bacterium]
MDWQAFVEAVAVFAAFLLAAQLLRRLADGFLERRQSRTGAVLLGTRVLYFGFIALGAFVALAIGLRAENVALIGVLTATLVTGLGVQDLMKNYVSGFYILFEKDIKVGDVIQFGDSAGTVTEVKARVTYLRGEQGELVIVPNSELFNSTVVVKTVREPPPLQAPRARRR